MVYKTVSFNKPLSTFQVFVMSRITITLVLLLLSLAQTRQQKSLIRWTDEDEVRMSSVSDKYLQFSLQVVSRHGQTVPVSEPVLVSRN